MAFDESTPFQPIPLDSCDHAQAVARSGFHSDSVRYTCGPSDLMEAYHFSSFPITLLQGRFPLGLLSMSAVPACRDVSFCHGWSSSWQSNLPKAADCWSAYKNLPSRASPVEFRNHPDHVPYCLPLIAKSV